MDGHPSVGVIQLLGSYISVVRAIDMASSLPQRPESKPAARGIVFRNSKPIDR